MILWIRVHSLFTTTSFISEFVDLLCTIDFRTNVVLSVVLAVGTHS